MATTRGSAADLLKEFGLKVLRKMGIVAAGWIAVYFISQPFRVKEAMLMLFAPMIGALAGVVAGWYLAVDSGEDSNLSGPMLWSVVVLGAILPIWVMEGIFYLILRWPVNFGGFMLLAAATILAMGAGVWQASSEES